jgi:hypothetical protein
MSAYRLAVLHTITTIDTRARYFRNLVVAIVMLTLGSMGWAVVTWTFSPLAGVLLLLPAGGLFFFLDAKLLNDWRSRLLDTWVKKEMELRVFCDAVSAIPTLPKETLQSMLATLPSAGDLSTEKRISSGTREVTAARAAAIYVCQSDAMALQATGFAITTGSLLIAVILWMWQPILGITGLALFPFMRKWLRRRRLRTLGERTAALQAKPDFSKGTYRELVARLPWSPISPVEKRAFFTRSRVGQDSPHIFT